MGATIQSIGFVATSVCRATWFGFVHTAKMDHTRREEGFYGSAWQARVARAEAGWLAGWCAWRMTCRAPCWTNCCAQGHAEPVFGHARVRGVSASGFARQF